MMERLDAEQLGRTRLDDAGRARVQEIVAELTSIAVTPEIEIPELGVSMRPTLDSWRLPRIDIPDRDDRWDDEPGNMSGTHD
jgi:hypothetical protein